MMNVPQLLSETCTRTQLEIVHLCMKLNLIKSALECRTCGVACSLKPSKNIPDGYYWTIVLGWCKNNVVFYL